MSTTTAVCGHTCACVQAHRGWWDADSNQRQRFFSGQNRSPFPASVISTAAQGLPWALARPGGAGGWAGPGPGPAELPRVYLTLLSPNAPPAHLTPLGHFQSCLRRGLDSDHRLFLKGADSSDVLVSHVGQCGGQSQGKSKPTPSAHGAGVPPSPKPLNIFLTPSIA